MILKVYKETDISNGEMLAVLEKLKFHEIPSDPIEYRLQHATTDLYVVMPRRPLNEFILKGYTAKISKMLLDFGIVEDFDDLVKMVLKERTKKRRTLKKQMEMA